MFERSTPGRLLELVPERGRTSANLILYFGTMSVEQRIQLRQQSVPTSGKGSPTLVIDEAVVGWLATREEPGFRVTQRVTLPFTAINPYTPFAGGDVPSEVFVGRDMERAEVESPTGSMFVYGGRQLGKSALLRRIEKLFTEPPDPRRQGRRVALYLDLKSESIGEARRTEDLWSVLIRPLKELRVIPENTPPNTGPDKVVQQIRQWLDQDEANRLLLLLDEADMFLTADSVPTEPGGTGQFRTLQRLKNLMESANRRFKPVFAGLHQVQRFHDSPNTPVAHGGADILIGPLRPAEVRKLIVDPIRAMGYAFDSDELVWRIAALTNYQASLIQIFCEALVDHLQKRISQRAGHTIITSDDIDGVYANRAVRELIAQRFRWTVNLDTRYRVIALVVTVLSLGDDLGSTFSADDLHDYCAIFWEKGFARNELRSKEFIRCLDEMVGLGVLHRSGDRYGIRSPNVIALLGTKQSLDQELKEAPEHFELPYEYNPTMSRMAIGGGPEGKRARSPLTDADLASLLGERESSAVGASRVRRVGTSYQVAVVTGTPALGIERVVPVLTTVAAGQGLTLEQVTLADIRRRLVERDRQHHHFLIEVDHRLEPLLADRIAELSRLMAGRGTVRAIVVVRIGSEQLLELPSSADVLHVTLHRWSMEGLRAWHEFPFETAVLRKQVHELTSGWPTLLEHAASQAADGRSTADVLVRLRNPFDDRESAKRFLHDVGLDKAAIAQARTWAASTTDIDDTGTRQMLPFSRADLEAVLADAGSQLDRMAAVEVAQQSLDGGWVLDPVVATALAAVD